MRARTIVLELLREGPPHNQLLSPLTPYLAACQNRPPESVRLSIEHRDFLRWQGALHYASSINVQSSPVRECFQTERRRALDDASRAVTHVLGSMRALIAELSSEPCEWRHVHLVLDASELGALPFELAHAAPGLVVEGERLFLQQNARITLTRQTRRVATSVVVWPQRPRILFVIGEGALPVEAHVLALRKAIDPWLGWSVGDATRDRTDGKTSPTDTLYARQRIVAEAERMLTVLENPTLEDVRAATRGGCFTHVHLLAHGAILPERATPGQSLYGLCFRGADGNVDVVDGDRLEAVLRPPRDCNHPTVVTLATCEGADVSGGILGPGGSVAHSLHAKGIPLVIASQFPMIKSASAVFADMMYRGLLRGEDPRETLHDLRRALMVAEPESHDWASLVMYASLPPDIDLQLARVRETTDRLAAEASVERLKAKAMHTLANVERLDTTFSAVRVYAAATYSLTTRVAANRLVASLSLRLWDVLHPLSTTGTASLRAVASLPQVQQNFITGRRPISSLSPRDLLRLARDSYRGAYFLDGSLWEVWLQSVVLTWALGDEDCASDEPALPDAEQTLREDLVACQYLADLGAERALRDATDADQQGRVLAAALKFEIELLAPAVLTKSPYSQQRLRQREESTAHTRSGADVAFWNFVRFASPIPESYRAFAAWRQLKRYEIWLQQRGMHATEASSYRDKLEKLGVRRSWGARI